MKAKIKKEFHSLFLNPSDMEKDCIESIENDFDEDDISSFLVGDEVEVLKTIPANGYDRPYDCYVVFHPVTKNSLTIASIFLDIEQAERVEQLEQELHFYEATKLTMDSVEKYTEQLKEENKRYREALEEVLITDEFEDPQDYIDRIVAKVLETLEGE